jgi:hypothetical protein
MPLRLHAWQFGTHHAAVMKAFEFMEGPLASELQQKAAKFLKIYGGQNIPAVIAEKSGNTDDFSDTCAIAWWSGKLHTVDLGEKKVNISTLWHFLTIDYPGHFGNEYAGFSFRFTPPGGGTHYNEILRAILYNHTLASAGFAGYGISMPVRLIGPIEAYRFRARVSYSRAYFSTTPEKNYERLHNTIFEPSINAAAFWYSQSLDGTAKGISDIQHIGYLGHVMHLANDATVTHHLYSTLDHYHDAYEQFVDDHLPSLYSTTKVADLISLFHHSEVGNKGLKMIMIKDIMLFFAHRSAGMTAPLYSDLYEVRKNCGTEQFCASIAQNVIIITKYYLDINIDEKSRRF